MNKTINEPIVIIGAGIVGCSTAFALAKRGYRTINLDKNPSAGYGSTSHSSAIVRPIYSHPTSVALAHESRSIWLDWQNFIGPGAPNGYAKYQECGGMVFIKKGEEAAYQTNIDALSTIGVPFTVISADEIAKEFPGIDLRSYGPPVSPSGESFAQPQPGQISSALLVEAAGYVSDPQLAAQNLFFAATKLGAEFRFNISVQGIHDNQLSLSTGDTLEAGTIVNASGPHSGVINRMAGTTLPIETKPVRHEVAYISATGRHFTGSGRFIADLDAGFYSRPDGVDIVIGSTDPDCDPLDIVDPENYNDSFTEQWTTQAYRAAQCFPELSIPNTARGTVGIYDVSDDWIPIYDRTDKPNYFVAIGTSGNQFKNAPLIGELMANVIERGEAHDREPATLHLEHINRVIDLDFFSRNRTVQNLSGVLA